MSCAFIELARLWIFCRENYSCIFLLGVLWSITDTFNPDWNLLVTADHEYINQLLLLSPSIGCLTKQPINIYTSTLQLLEKLYRFMLFSNREEQIQLNIHAINWNHFTWNLIKTN